MGGRHGMASGWPVRPLLARAAAAAVLAGLAAGCGHAAPGHGQSGRPATRAAAAAGAGWRAGRGGKRLDAVSADAARLSAALRAGGPGMPAQGAAARRAAARRAATRLSADALAALRGPMPPAGAALYRAALADFRAAGAAVRGGNAGQAARLVVTGTVDVTKVTEAADTWSGHGQAAG